MQTDVFPLQPGRPGDLHHAIEARGGTVDIQSVRLIYRSGESDRFRIREQLRPGEMTGIFRKQSPGPLTEVEVNYVPEGQVTLIRRAGAGPVVEPPPLPCHLDELGCKTVGFLIDRDAVNADLSGLYPALRLRSTGLDIEMLDLAALCQWPQDIYHVNAIIRSGERSTPIDLQGRTLPHCGDPVHLRPAGLRPGKPSCALMACSSAGHELEQEQKTTSSKRSDLSQARENCSHHFKAVGL